MGTGTSGAKKNAVAIFAAGCFWSKEYAFSRQPGVIATRVGYTGGFAENPSYREVCSKLTGHAEAVEVTYDPEKTDFQTLARFFFEIHNPSIDRRDKGGQYRSAIFYADEEQLAIAQDLIRQLEDRGIEVFTQLEPAGEFWTAEARHQKFCDTRGMEPTDRYTKRFE